MQNRDFQDAEAILAPIAEWARLSTEGVSIATFAGFDRDGQFLVELSNPLETRKALSTIAFEQNDVGSKIVVAFEKGNILRPVIVGHAIERAQPTAVNLKVDDGRITLRAEQEIELRCGDASIVLTRAGKILIRGNYVLSRSRGANKIKGAVVDIN